jgi:phosphate ABC transporter phosphate-binding protein
VAPLTLRRALRARLTVAVLTVVSAAFLTFAPPASAASYVSISGAGSTWVQPAINQWQLDVQQDGLTVNYSGVGDTSGRTEFAAGAVDFAATEIPYAVPDMFGQPDNPPARGYAYMPDVAGGTVFMYNLVIGGQRVTNLRLGDKTVADIFTGAIRYWDDPEIKADNPDLALPHIQIVPVVRSDGSGATADFTQWILATDPSAWQTYCSEIGVPQSDCIQTSAYPVWSGDPQMVAERGDTGVSGFVSQNVASGAIGYVEYSYALASGFPVAKLLNAAGYYTAPTPGNVGVSLLDAQFNSDGTANLSQVYTDTDPRTYELSSYSYLIVPTDQTFPLTADQGYSLGAFGSFLLCQGQQPVDALGYSPLPINLVEAGYAQLAKIPGAQVPATTAAFIQSCNNPTFSTDGTNTLATNDPMPPACDQQGATQCNSQGNGTVAGTITTVTATPNPPVADQSVTLTATVTSSSGATPAGSVQFSVGGTLIGSPVTLDSSGVATTTQTFTTPGTQVVSAAFTTTDSSAFQDSSGSLSLTVAPSSDAIGQTVTVTNPPAGAFTFTAPTTSTITLTFNGNTAFGAMNAITITDTRNTYPGWSVLGQASDFTNPTSQPAGDFSGTFLGWAPSGELASGAVLGPAVTPASPGLGTTGAVLASASAGAGFGTSTLGAELLLRNPPLAPSGAYTGVLTLTADPAVP